MRRAKKVVAEPVNESVNSTPVAEEIKVVSKLSADVIGRDGNIVRTYSQADHGENFAKLAEQYASKIGGSVR